jgi:hypothetical protein
MALANVGGSNEHPRKLRRSPLLFACVRDRAAGPQGIGHAANRQCPLGQAPAPVPRPGAPVSATRNAQQPAGPPQYITTTANTNTNIPHSPQWPVASGCQWPAGAWQATGGSSRNYSSSPRGVSIRSAERPEPRRRSQTSCAIIQHTAHRQIPTTVCCPTTALLLQHLPPPMTDIAV